MKLISKEKHAQLLAAAKKAAHKQRSALAAAKSTVSVWILQELGLSPSKEAVAKWEAVKKEPASKRRSNNVATAVPMLDYIKALKAYEPSDDVVEDLFKKTFSTEPAKQGK